LVIDFFDVLTYRLLKELRTFVPPQKGNLKEPSEQRLQEISNAKICAGGGFVVCTCKY